MSEHAPLKPLHAEMNLSVAKLAMFEKLESDVLTGSLAPGQEHCLKARPVGTMLDGHHRVRVLRARNIDVNALPREVLR